MPPFGVLLAECCCQNQPGEVGCTDYPSLMLYRNAEGGLPQGGRPAWWQGIQTSQARVSCAFTMSGTKNGTPFSLTVNKTLHYQGGRADQIQLDAPYETYTAPNVGGPWSGGLDAEWAYCYRYRIPVFEADTTHLEYPYSIVLAPADPFACGSLVDLNAAGFILEAPEIAALTGAVGGFSFDDFFSDPEGGTWLSVSGDRVNFYVPLKSLLPDDDWYEFEGDGSDTCCEWPHSEAVWRCGGDGMTVERDLSFSSGGATFVVHLEASITTTCWAKPNYSRTTCGCRRSPTEFNPRFKSFNGSVQLQTGEPGVGCDECVYTTSVPFSGTCTWSCSPPPYNGVYFDASERYRGYTCLTESGVMTWPLHTKMCVTPTPPVGECEGCLDATFQGDPNSVSVTGIGILPCEFSPGGTWPHSWLPNGYIEVGGAGAYDADNPACLVGWSITIDMLAYFRWNDGDCDGVIGGTYTLYDKYGTAVGTLAIG